MANIQTTLQAFSWPYTFNMLDTYIRATGLEYTLQGEGPLTFFAPSDEAFRLHNRSAYDVLKNIETLKALLQYHIVPLKLTSADFKAYVASQPRHTKNTASDEHAPDEVNALQVPTALQSPLALTISAPDVLRVQGVQVVKADVEADNGIIHIIDGILWPPNMSEESFGLRNPSHYAPQIPGQEAVS